jgi:GNAT superfamily N-acetyltransferase
MPTPVETMLKIRAATADDIPLILDFIRSLAEYERAPHEVIVTADDLMRDGFGADPKFRVVIAEWDNDPVGFAFFFHHYSTWLGKAGIYLEDLFVKPEFRGKGIGKALLRHLAGIAVRENCYGLRWQVLDWNTPAIDFYKALGAEIMQEWLTVRLKGDALARLAGEQE